MQPRPIHRRVPRHLTRTRATDRQRGYGCVAMGPGGFPARSFLELLLDQERGALFAAGRARQWQSGEMLVRAGDRADSATVLLSGSVKVHKTAAEGAEVVLAVLGAGDLLGEMSALPE